MELITLEVFGFVGIGDLSSRIYVDFLINEKDAFRLSRVLEIPSGLAIELDQVGQGIIAKVTN